MNHNRQEIDPIAHDQDRFVHPDETRTDEQIAFDEKYAVEPYGNESADEYWAEYDYEFFSRKPEMQLEDKFDFTEKDLMDRNSALVWLEEAADEYERIRHDDYAGDISHYSEDNDSKALYRVLENGFYATSDDNVYAALRTIHTGVLRRAEYYSTWPDGSYKAAVNIQNSELELEEFREFMHKFAELQRKRDESIAKDGFDPMGNQMKEVFGMGGVDF